MPADDLILNVRQIAGYGPTASAPSSAALLMQMAGLGSAYASISPADLVGTALATGGDMAIAGSLMVQELQGGSAQFSNAAVGLLSAQKACIVDLAAGSGTVAGARIATANDLATMVSSVNGRVGAVVLGLDDIIRAGGAPIYSPYFTGCPQAPTPPIGSASNALATTWFVTNAVATALGVAFDGYAPLASPAFTGIPTAPTAAQGSADGQLATTTFVTAAIAAGMTGVVTTFNGRAGAVNLIGNDVSAAGGALLASPAFTGTPTAPTAAPSTSNTQLATCAFVMAAVATGGGVLTFNGRSGAVTLTAADLSAVGGALLASPALTGSPTAPTAGPGTNTTQLATCAFVMAAVAAATAGVASFNGRTGAVSLIATDVTAVLPAATANPVMNGVASPGTLAAWSRGDHVHPVDTSRYAATNPSNFQTAAQVTASLAGYLSLAGGTLTGTLNGTAATFAGNLTLSNGVIYQFGTNAIGFGWGGGSAGSGATFFVDGTQLGNLVRTGAGTGLAYSAIDQQGLNGTGPSVVWAYSGGQVSVPVTFSDRRLKSNLQPATVDALDLIDRLKVYEADLRNPLPGGQPQHWDCSLIADELDEVIPHARVKASGAEGSFDGVNPYPIVCALVRAVQQLTARLAALEARTA
jgi:hypothetical protein